ncbi:hypothetical protein EVAR_49412_1 [Eumeta japonica]|uniref:Uncharacterized protein n=1 Tax=Eumeta variegata TaxID=151549 RepID=A0A4C1Y838_EUMVA|nr:hypothetical protein EVAR_49412_1 [Eumeta japonica]
MTQFWTAAREGVPSAGPSGSILPFREQCGVRGREKTKGSEPNGTFTFLLKLSANDVTFSARRWEDFLGTKFANAACDINRTAVGIDNEKNLHLDLNRDQIREDGDQDFYFMIGTCTEKRKLSRRTNSTEPDFAVAAVNSTSQLHNDDKSEFLT